MAKVSVIIVNYNTYRLTSACVQSVIDHTKGVSFEIILVDNASTECDPEKFLEEYPEIKLVRSAENSGFAAGNNLGILEASGEYILLLNSDTLLTEDSITKTISYFETLAHAGVLGCRMTYPDGTLQYTARRFRSISWELLDLFRFIPFLMSYQSRADRMLGKYFRHDVSRDCDWVNGAFFLFSKKILEKMPGGKLDDRFFMYGEDQLWCEQVKAQGYSNLFYAGTSIIHINSGSTEISKQLQLRKTMRRHELEIMKMRKGKGFYYYVFLLIFVAKEKIRNGIKFIYFKLSGRLIR